MIPNQRFTNYSNAMGNEPHGIAKQTLRPTFLRIPPGSNPTNAPQRIHRRTRTKQREAKHEVKREASTARAT